MRKKIILSLIISSLLNTSKTVITVNENNLPISFDKLFPETQIEQLQKTVTQLSFLINNAQKNQLKLIENDLLHNLMDIYAISYSFDNTIKRNQKTHKNDLIFLAKLINHNNKILNEKFAADFGSKLESFDVIFHKLLENLDKIIHQATYHT